MYSPVSPNRQTGEEYPQSPIQNNEQGISDDESSLADRTAKTANDDLKIPGTPPTNNPISQEGCCTPVLYSQGSILSQSQEIIPLHQYHEELRKASLSIHLPSSDGCSESTESINSSSRPVSNHSSLSIKTSELSSSWTGTESTNSLPPSSGKGDSDPSHLPSRKTLITTIYRKLKCYLEEEMDRVSSPTALNFKTPGKFTFSSGKVCPPLKKINRRACSPSYSSTDQLTSPKRQFLF